MEKNSTTERSAPSVDRAEGNSPAEETERSAPSVDRAEGNSPAEENSKMELQCPALRCDYKTPAMKPELAMQMLQLHDSNVHRTAASPAGCKAESLKRPQATTDMSETTWRDFESQWTRYKRSTGIQGQQAIDQLVSCCSDSLRMDVNSETGGAINHMTESEILEAMRLGAVRKTNPMVHRNTLRDMKQGESELFRSFVSRLKEAAIDCKFEIKCSKNDCNTVTSYSEDMVRDQAVYGLNCKDTQARILAASAALSPLKDVILLAEAEEQAKITQAKITTSQVNVNSRRATAYKKKKLTRQQDSSLPCNYCGNVGHGNMPDRDERKHKCPAWDKTCNYCDKKGHIEEACKVKAKEHRKDRPSLDASTVGIIADHNSAAFCTLTNIPGIQRASHGEWKLDHVEWKKERGWYKTRPKDMPKVPLDIEVMNDEHAALYPDSLINTKPVNTCKARNWFCTPDTGAQVTVAGTSLLSRLNVRQADLIPVSQKVSTANDVHMTILGAIIVKFTSMSSPKRSTLQLCYIAKQCHGVYLSLSACKSLNIVHATFPQPIPRLSSITDPTHIQDTDSCKRVIVNHGHNTVPCGCPVRASPPPLPTELPCPASNTAELKTWILKRYAASAFNTCCTQPLPSMHGDPLVIALKPDAKPSAVHVPAPVPIHYQAEVKKALDRDVALGVLEKVPVNTPVKWLHRMVITPKKNGSPRRTVDLQSLNRASIRQTHHTASPFHTASSIPKGVKKTCLDAWNGYHSVLLDESSRELTSFITPWGVYRYKTAPQGYLASGDAYTHRYDNIVKDFGDIAKCVDDVCLWGNSEEETFFKTCRYLDLCSKNGIVFNPEKFVFCEDEVEFLGFMITTNSVKPATHMLQSIQDFPAPTDISGVRSFFGLINQVSYAFSMADTMVPFRDLLKPSTPFYWDETLQKLFESAKTEILQQIVNGVNMFDKNRITCLATDWSKTGIGYFLSQKYCTCSTITPICCQNGWKIVLAGSRFTKPAESRYHPVEGEALAVAYALHKTRYYIQGCKQLIVATDHHPLLKIFGDRNLEDISNPRLLNFKEKTLPYIFQMVYVPGKKHDGPDSMSRHPVSAVPSKPDDALLSAVRITDKEMECLDPAKIAVTSAMNQIQAVSVERVGHETARDPSLQSLMETIQNGFPPSKELCPDEVKEYFRHREELSVSDGIILFKNRVLIPQSLRSEVLQYLHSAHQGTQGMKARAAETIFWPGISAAIHNTRARCKTCNTITPSQASEPPVTAEPPQYPYEQVCADYFELGGIQYLAMADRYSGWLSVKCFPRGGASASALVAILREWFMMFGAPKELASDGGTTFMSEVTQNFLKTWGIRHRVSSVAFPHSNCRAELAVKTAKRLIRDNVGPHGSLETDKFACALMQYRNTPLQGINLSPAQILLGRKIRDFFPLTPSNCKIRTEWLISAEERERALARRHATHVERLSLHTHQLPPLAVGETVLIQNQVGNNPTRWEKTGVVIELGPGPRQYYVRTDGSGRVTLRNRRFLRKCSSVAEPTFPVLDTSRPNTSHPNPAHVDDTERTTHAPGDISDTLMATPDNPSEPTPLPTLPNDTSTSETPLGTPTTETQSVSSTPKTELRRSSRIRREPERYGNYISH